MKKVLRVERVFLSFFWAMMFLVVVPAGMNYFDYSHPYWNDLSMAAVLFVPLFFWLDDLKKLKWFERKYESVEQYLSVIKIAVHRIYRIHHYFYSIYSMKASLTKKTRHVVEQDRLEVEKQQPHAFNKQSQQLPCLLSETKIGYSSYAWIPKAMQILDKRVGEISQTKA